MPHLILAPLRGVTNRTFREAASSFIKAAHFTEAFTPFIPATSGYDISKDREIKDLKPICPSSGIRITPQFIGKDPLALRDALLKAKSKGFETCDLNCGCPFPMIRKKGRGAGLLNSRTTLARMIEEGVRTMGEGQFSIKTRLGIASPDELLSLVDLFNSFPLRFITVHARTAVQMYDGKCDRETFKAFAKASRNLVIYNGDAPLPDNNSEDLMIGRFFIRMIGLLDESSGFLQSYVSLSMAEGLTSSAVLGRVKELVAYWKDSPRWKRIWPVLKLSRTLQELLSCINISL